MNYMRDNSEDPFKKLRAMMVRLGYHPMNSYEPYPVDYRKDGFSVCLFNYDSTPTVSFRNVEEERAVCIGTTDGMLAFQFRNIPMAIMKKAIRHPENAYSIFNKYDIERAINKL